MKNIVCIGGGPAGLYYAILHKKNNRNDRVVVIDRNKSGVTFGWGVVFSDTTMNTLFDIDEISANNIYESLNHWDDIEASFKGETFRSTGHGFIGIGRLKLLSILQNRCEQLGVELVQDSYVQDEEIIAKKYGADLIIASDGISSLIRNKYEKSFDVDTNLRDCRFIWLGTHKLFDAFTFIFEQTEFGWMSVHAYKFNNDTSTFIVEMREEDWYKAGIDKMSKDESIAYCEKVFAKQLDGNKLISNDNYTRGSANWIRFPRIICNTWHTYQNLNGKNTAIVLMGDASHTAHFSIGSGTKLALEDAISLSGFYNKHNGDLEKTFREYEVARRIEVAKIQNSARNSTWWFEQVALHENMTPNQFYYSLLTRSQRISHENLYLRDKEFIINYENKFFNGEFPVQSKFNISSLSFNNSYILDIASTSTKDNISKFYEEQSKSGCSLILSEAININIKNSLDDDKIKIWQNIINTSHKNGSKIALELNHCGSENFSIQEYIQSLQEKEMNNIIDNFKIYAKHIKQIGADILILNFAYKNLFASFLSPISNQRKDEYGDTLINRMKFPINVLKGIQEVCQLPIGIRINAKEKELNGFNMEDTIILCEKLKELNVDVIIVSSGNKVDKKKRYERMYNVSFSDEIKHKVNIPVICTGGISNFDEANSILASCRADMVAIDSIDILKLSMLEQLNNMKKRRK